MQQNHQTIPAHSDVSSNVNLSVLSFCGGENHTTRHLHHPELNLIYGKETLVPHFWYQFVATAAPHATSLSLLTGRRRLQPTIRLEPPESLPCLLQCKWLFSISTQGDRSYQGRFRISRFSKRGNTIQLYLGQTLPLPRSPDGQRPEDGRLSEQGSFFY